MTNSRKRKDKKGYATKGAPSNPRANMPTWHLPFCLTTNCILYIKQMIHLNLSNYSLSKLITFKVMQNNEIFSIHFCPIFDTSQKQF